MQQLTSELWDSLRSGWYAAVYNRRRVGSSGRARLFSGTHAACDECRRISGGMDRRSRGALFGAGEDRVSAHSRSHIGETNRTGDHSRGSVKVYSHLP